MPNALPAMTTPLKLTLLSGFALLLGACSGSPVSKGPEVPRAPGLAFAESNRSADDAFGALVEALGAAEPVTVVARVDHAANAASVGLELRPTFVVLFGNPRLGTPIMQENQTAGIDLPQKLLAYESEDGTVYAAYNTTDYLARRHGVGGAETLPQIAGALERFLGLVRSGPIKQIPPRGIREGAGLVSVPSAYGVDETHGRLKDALHALPPVSILAELDHAANAARVGLELRPTRLIVFGNPRLGTPLMQDEQTIAIDLPQKVLIYEDASGDVFLVYNDPYYLARRHGIDEDSPALSQIRQALENLATTATGS